MPIATGFDRKKPTSSSDSRGMAGDSWKTVELWSPNVTLDAPKHGRQKKKTRWPCWHGKGGERWSVACLWRLVDEANSCWQWTCPKKIQKMHQLSGQNQWSTVLIKPAVFLRYFTSDSDVDSRVITGTHGFGKLYLATRSFNSSFLMKVQTFTDRRTAMPSRASQWVPSPLQPTEPAWQEIKYERDMNFEKNTWIGFYMDKQG